MPYRNRVTPTGELIAVDARGTLTGNRGIIHEPGGRIVRRYATRRWIACVLEYKDWRRTVMEPRRWTHLFFLDEATALSAGHRPCALCRRADHLAFTAAWARARGLEKAPLVDPIDRVLHEQRHPVRTHAPARAAELPAGAFVRLEGEPWLVLTKARIARWTPAGYVGHTSAPDEPLPLITPPAMVATLRAGYAAKLHPTSAG